MQKISIVSTLSVLTLCMPIFTVLSEENILISPPPPFVQHAQTTKNDATEQQVTVFQSPQFLRGDKKLGVYQNQSMTLFLSGRVLAIFNWHLATRGKYWNPDYRFTNFSNTTDEKNKSISGHYAFPLSDDGSTGDFSQNVKLLDDGRLEINYSYQCPKDRTDGFRFFDPSIIIPQNMAVGTSIVVNDDNTVTIPAKGKWPNNSSDSAGDKIELGSFDNIKRLNYNKDNPEDGFTIEFPESVKIGLSLGHIGSSHSVGEGYLFIRPIKKFSGEGGELKMILDFGKSRAANVDGDCIVEGINFTQSDNLDVPVYKGSANMLMNPSFEAGTRYYLPTDAGGKFKDMRNMIVNCAAPYGRRALWVRGDIKCMGIPIAAGIPYTISFYAKPTDKNNAQVKVIVRSYSKFEESKTFDLDPDKWTRCSHTFTIPHSEVKFRWASGGALVGGIQLEKGEAETPYAGNRFGVDIDTDAKVGLVCDASKPLNARLILRGPVNAQGKIHVRATDFFYRNYFNKDFDFSLGEQGTQELALALDAVMPLGPTVLKVEVNPDNAPAYTDYLRLNKIKFVGNNFKNKQIHSFCKYGYNIIDSSQISADELALFQNCGFGRHTYYTMSIKPLVDDFEKFESHGMDVVSVNAYELLERLVANNGEEGPRFINRYKGEKLSGFELDPGKIDEITPAFEKILEESFCEIGRRYPFVKCWMGFTEPIYHFKLLRQGNFDEYAKLQIAMCKGLKRGNPQTKVIFGGACNITPNGIAETVKVMEACKNLDPSVTFDGVEIHTYRSFPEQPDTDQEMSNVFEAVKKLGYGDDFPVYFNEGAYFYPLDVPEWINISPWSSTTASKDMYSRMGTPSYDMGWAERLAAAMTLRYWLVCYKYADKIEAATPWGPSLLDNRTPYARILMSGTLAEMLGNATFKKDIRFYPGARAYVFEDLEKRPVAAVWYFSEKVERGKELPPKMVANFKRQNLEFYDMFGNKCNVPQNNNGDLSLPLSNFPFYVRGNAEDMSLICEGIGNSRVGKPGESPLKISMLPVSTDSLSVTVKNPLSNIFAGTVQLDNAAPTSLNISPNSGESLLLNCKNCAPFDGISNLAVPVAIKATEGIDVNTTLNLRAFSATHVLPGRISIDGLTTDWENIPAIRLTADGDSAINASFRIAWNEKSLYLQIETNILHASRADTPESSENKKNNCIVSLAFDTLADAQAKSLNNNFGYDENDYLYELISPEGTTPVCVFRRNAPDTQLTGGVNHGLLPGVFESGVYISSKLESDKQIYEIEFPLRYLEPLNLRNQSVFGLGIKIEGNNKDAYLDNLGENAKFINPHKYPQVLLCK